MDLQQISYEQQYSAHKATVMFQEFKIETKLQKFNFKIIIRSVIQTKSLSYVIFHRNFINEKY